MTHHSIDGKFFLNVSANIISVLNSRGVIILSITKNAGFYLSLEEI